MASAVFWGCPLSTVEPLYQGHGWDLNKSPQYEGVLISEYYTVMYYVGDLRSVPNVEVSIFHSVLITEVPL